MGAPEPGELLDSLRRPAPDEGRGDAPAVFRPGTFLHPARPKRLEELGLPHARDWRPQDADWRLPPGWRETVLEGMRERLLKHRSFHLFMDVCVRCGACADKCQFFLGSGDPRNMPVLRAELLRSVWRREFTTAGRLLGRLAGARELTPEVVREWYLYFHQCSECRRCSVYCPFGIDTAEITMMARELLQLIGLAASWIVEPAANSWRVGNHLGLQPHALRDAVDGLVDDLEAVTGVRVAPSIGRKGAEVLFVTPSADFFATPAIYTFMGYLLLFHQVGLDYTLSAYASEGGNFGLFASHGLLQRLNARIYAESRRLGVRWLLGGECGHMWRVVHQYMATLNGPADHLEVPVSPVTGTRFAHAAATKMVHVCEFADDLIRHGRVRLDPARNRRYRATFHDSCNTARGMGLLEEPRRILRSALPPGHFHEMPENTIRERTYCCGSGGGLNADELLETRLRGGFPRASALRHVVGRHGVNLMATVCAIDKAALTSLVDYWVPGVEIAGVHELLGNALVLDGETRRERNLRGEPLAGG